MLGSSLLLFASVLFLVGKMASGQNGMAPSCFFCLLELLDDKPSKPY